MNTKQAREFLVAAVATETGRQALRALGLEQVIDAPDKGDDRSTIKVAEMLREQLYHSYRF